VIKSEKKLSQLSDILKSKENLVIIEAIKSLRDEEPFEGAIGLLTSFFDMTTDKAIQRTIEEFFSDLKDSTLRKEVIAERRKPYKQNTTGMLVGSCWQSGLDYSEYLSDMAKIFIEGDYNTAIECLTVIEESVQKCSNEIKMEALKMIESSTKAGTHEKFSLTQELIAILMK
jgi:hypothetical protein